MVIRKTVPWLDASEEKVSLALAKGQPHKNVDRLELSKRTGFSQFAISSLV